MGLDRDDRAVFRAALEWWPDRSGADRVPPGWAEVLRLDPMLRDARVVVDLVLAGGQVRILVGPDFAQAAAGATNGPRRVFGELEEEPVLSEDVEPGSGGLGRRSVSVSLSGRLVRPASILATGSPIAGHGEVSILCEGMSWDDRIVWIRGPVSGGVDFGRLDEWVTLTVSDPNLAGQVVPPWVLDAERWPRIPDTSIGQRVPIVIGDAIVPCPRIDSQDAGGTDRFVVAQGHRGLVLDSAWVRAGDDVRPQLDATGTLTETDDAIHLQTTLIAFSSGPASDPAEEDCEVFARVREPATALVGLTVVEAIRRLIRDHDSDRISARLFSEAASRSAQFGAASGGSYPRVVINAPAGLYDYIGNDLLSDHPYLSLVWDGGRVGPVAVDHRAPPVADLAIGAYPVIARSEGARYRESPVDDLRTSFTVRYDYTPVTDVWRGVAVRNPGNNNLCSMAASLLGGEQIADDVEALSVRDAATAEFILDWLCEHFCRVSYDVEVDAYPAAWFHVRLGDTVRWTDPDVGFEQEEAIVIGREWSRGLVRLTLRIYPDLWRVGGGSESFQ